MKNNIFIKVFRISEEIWNKKYHSDLPEFWTSWEISKPKDTVKLSSTKEAWMKHRAFTWSGSMRAEGTPHPLCVRSPSAEAGPAPGDVEENMYPLPGSFPAREWWGRCWALRPSYFLQTYQSRTSLFCTRGRWVKQDREPPGILRKKSVLTESRSRLKALCF